MWAMIEKFRMRSISGQQPRSPFGARAAARLMLGGRLWPRSCGEARPESVGSGGGRRGEPVARHDAVVVEPDQLDHVADVVVIVDAARRHRVLPREDRVIDHTPLLSEGRADVLAKAEVRRVVAVQVPNLVA